MNRKEITSINNRTYELMYNNYYDITLVMEVIDGIDKLEFKNIGLCYGNLLNNDTMEFIKDIICDYEEN